MPPSLGEIAEDAPSIAPRKQERFKIVAAKAKKLILPRDVTATASHGSDSCPSGEADPFTEISSVKAMPKERERGLLKTSSTWKRIGDMSVITSSPYEANESAEVGEVIFDRLKELLAPAERESGRRRVHATQAAIDVFGDALARSLVLASYQIALSGMVYSSDWQNGSIRGVHFGEIPAPLLLLCLQEQRFVRPEAMLGNLIQDLELDDVVKDAICEWGLERKYTELFLPGKRFVFNARRSACQRCEIFVARTYVCMRALKMARIADGLMEKVEACLTIMKEGISSLKPERKSSGRSPTLNSSDEQFRLVDREAASICSIRPSSSAACCARGGKAIEKVCMHTGKVLSTFDTATAAAQSLGLKNTTRIYQAASGKRFCYKGHFWRYAGCQEFPSATLSEKGSGKPLQSWKNPDYVRHESLNTDFNDRPNQVEEFSGETGSVENHCYGKSIGADEPSRNQRACPNGLSHVLLANLGATRRSAELMDDSSNDGGTKPVEEDVPREATLTNDASSSEVVKPEAEKPTVSMIASYPPITDVPEELPWFPNDPQEIILNATEEEIAWLVEESIYCFRSKVVRWDFVWEYASPALKIELRRIKYGEENQLEQLVRISDVLVGKRFPIKRKHIRRELHRGFIRDRMQQAISELRLQGRFGPAT